MDGGWDDGLAVAPQFDERAAIGVFVAHGVGDVSTIVAVGVGLARASMHQSSLGQEQSAKGKSFWTIVVDVNQLMRACAEHQANIRITAKIGGRKRGVLPMRYLRGFGASWHWHDREAKIKVALGVGRGVHAGQDSEFPFMCEDGARGIDVNLDRCSRAGASPAPTLRDRGALFRLG